MKYVIAKSYYGLGGNLSVLSTAMLLAKNLERNIIVDWRGGSYGGQENYFLDLFEPIDRLDSIDILPGCCSVFPDYWTPYYKQAPLYKSGVPLTMSSTDLVFSQGDDFDINSYNVIVIARDSSFFHHRQYEAEMRSVFRELTPKRSILNLIDEFKASFFNGEVIGVHYRHGNGEATVVPPDFDWFVDSVRQLQAKSQSKKCKVFIATDCKAALDAFIIEFGDAVISFDKIYPAIGAGGMHYKTDKTEKINSAVEALIDIHLLSKCDYFVGSKSFFSTCANYWSKGFSRENSKWYMPKLRAFKPEPWMISLSKNKPLFQAFGGNKYPTDNLYFLDNDGYDIYFQQIKIGSIGYDLNPALVDQVKAAVCAARLY